MLSCSNEIEDPFFVDQWNLNNIGQQGGTPGADINICSAWDITKGSNDAVIAILDYGIQTNHPDLTNLTSFSYDVDAQMSPGYCCLPHGMRVAGISGADHNNIGIAGISPESPLMSITNSNFPSPNIVVKWADAIDVVRQNGASVITCAWRYSQEYPEIEEAVENAFQLGRNGKGSIIVSGSGNSGIGSLGYPASYNSVLAVGATTRQDNRASFSDYGAGLDVVAPGVDIPTLDYNPNPSNPSNNYYIMSGTSPAASHVSSLVALILSVNNDLTYLEVVDIIRSSAQKVGGYNYVVGQGHNPNLSWNNQMGFGRIDACEAIMETFKKRASIAGPDRICTSSTNYNLQNIPAGANVSWTATPSYLFGGASGSSGTGTTAPLRAGNTSVSGLGTITFTIETNCGSRQITKQLWVGIPSNQINIVPNYQPICPGEYTYFNGSQPGNQESDIINYVWDPPSGVNCFTAGNKNEVLACWFQNNGFNHTIGVRAVNSCGQGSFNYANFGVGCYYFSVSLNPNPAHGEVNIDLTETPLDEKGKAILQLENKHSKEYQEYSFDKATYRVKIYDINGVEKYCREEEHEALRQTLDISHLAPGMYVVHIEHGNGTVIRQLKVE